MCTQIFGESEHAPYNVLVLQLLQETDFPDSRAGDAFILSLQTDLLERDDLVGGEVFGLVDHAVGT